MDPYPILKGPTDERLEQAQRSLERGERVVIRFQVGNEEYTSAFLEVVAVKLVRRSAVWEILGICIGRTKQRNVLVAYRSGLPESEDLMVRGSGCVEPRGTSNPRLKAVSSS